MTISNLIIHRPVLRAQPLPVQDRGEAGGRDFQRLAVWQAQRLTRVVIAEVQGGIAHRVRRVLEALDPAPGADRVWKRGPSLGDY